MTRWDWINRVTSPGGPESTTVRYVMVVLVLHFFNDVERCAWPKVETLAARTGHKSIRTVQEALGEAEATGWLRRDAKPGRVTYYFPTIPENRALMLDPAKSAGLTPQERRTTPQKAAGDPADSADDLRKEPRRDSRKEGPTPCLFSCPVPSCRGRMRRISPKRGSGPDFFGCVAYANGRGCPGKRELDGTDSTPKSLKGEAPNMKGMAESVMAATMAAKAQIAREASEPSPLTDYDPVRLRRARA